MLDLLVKFSFRLLLSSSIEFCTSRHDICQSIDIDRMSQASYLPVQLLNYLVNIILLFIAIL